MAAAGRRASLIQRNAPSRPPAKLDRCCLRLSSLLRRLPLGTAWIIACAAAELIGMTLAAIAFGAGAWLDAQPGFPTVAARWLTYVLALLAGRRFVAVMVAIGVIGWAIGMLPSTLFAADEINPAADPVANLDPVILLGAAALLGAAGGIVIGSAQAVVLRPVACGLRTWVALNGLGWAAAFVVIFAGAGALPADVPLIGTLAFGALTGVAAGAALGLATLPALKRLVAR